MAKEGGAKTVIGGKKDITTILRHCWRPGDFSTVDTQTKTMHLKNNTLAPPDLYVSPLTYGTMVSLSRTVFLLTSTFD